VLVTALLVPVALGDFLESRSDRRDWDSAASSGRALLRDVKRLVPDPPPGTTIFTFGVSGYSAPSVPIFGGGGSNDLLGAVRVTYDSGAVAGFPVLDGMTFRCGEAEMDLADTGEPSAAPYGRAVLVDLARRRVLRPRDRAGCRRATEALKPYAPVNETEG